MLYAVLMYPLAYFYLRGVMFPQSYSGWEMPVFAALFIVYVDCAARAAHRTAAKETPLWAVCWMALAVAYPLYGYQPGPLGVWQWPAWHLFAVWYVLARCGMLAQGQSGSLAPLDALAGFVLLPFGNFFLRARTVFAALRTRLQDRTGARKVLYLIVTAAVTLALCGVAWGLLAAADANFAAQGQQVSDWWGRLLNNESFIDRLMYILLSLPVGAWLYGLVGGSLRRKAPPTTAQQCAAVLENCRIVPRTTAVAAVIALCGVYALFFAVQAGEWLPCAAGAGRTGHRRFCGERLLGAAENPAAQFCGAGGHTVLWPCAAAQSVGRRVLRVRRGFCCAGSGQAGCLCDALRPDAPAVHGGMVPVCAGRLCGAGAGAGVQADPGGEARDFCGSSQLYIALLRECEAAGH